MVTIQRVKGEGYERLQIALKNLDGYVGKVGWFENSKYPPKSKTGHPINVAYVAAIQEYGYAPKNIPPRPFFRPTIADKQQSWAKIVEAGARAILRGTQTVYTVMEGLGGRAAGDVRATIDSLWSPSLKEATILARAYRRKLGYGEVTLNLTKPLIDTNVMYSTLTHTVESG